MEEAMYTGKYNIKGNELRECLFGKNFLGKL
jgi:hypothetical protein